MEPTSLRPVNSFPVASFTPSAQMQQMPYPGQMMAVPQLSSVQPQMMAPMPQMQQMQPMLPSASAVSINIIGPQAYAGAPVQSPYNYPMNPVYNYANNPYYGVPQGSVYNPQPVMPQQPYMQQPMAQQPYMQQPMYPQAYPAPQPMPPVMPPPPAIDQQPPQPVQGQPVQQPQQAPQPIDVQALNMALTSPNLDEQTNAIQKMAEVGQTNKEQASSLLNEQTFRALADIIAKDTTKLQGVDKEKSDANKMIGMWTLAILQKNFREAMDAEAQKQGIPSVTVSELPGIVPVIENIKNDPNPTIREAGISALAYVSKPEDSKVLNTIFTIATKDKDPNVKAAAQQQLNNLQQLQKTAK